MLAYGVATVALAATLVSAAILELDALEAPGQCGTMAVKWRGGTPPYTVSITKVEYPDGAVDTNTRVLTGPGGDPNQAPDKAFSTLEWEVNYPARSKIKMELKDGAGNDRPIPEFYVGPGTDACLTTASSSPSTLPSPTAGTTESSSPLASNSPSGSNSDPPSEPTPTLSSTGPAAGLSAGALAASSTASSTASPTASLDVASGAVSTEASIPADASESSDADAAGSGASNSSSHKSKSNTGAIAGGVVGGIAAILALLLLLFLCRRRRNRRRPSMSRAPSGGPIGTLAPPPKDDDHDTVTPDSTASKRMTFLSYNGNDSSVGHGSSIGGPDDEKHSSFGHVSGATTVLAGMTDSGSLSPPPSHARYSNHTPQSSPRNSTIPPSPLSDAGVGAAALATVPATPIAASARSPCSTANVTSWAGSQAGHTSPPNSPRSGQTVWGSPKSQQSPWGSNTDSLMVDDAYGSDDDVPKGRSLPPPPRPVRL